MYFMKQGASESRRGRTVGRKRRSDSVIVTAGSTIMMLRICAVVAALQLLCVSSFAPKQNVLPSGRRTASTVVGFRRGICT